MLRRSLFLALIAAGCSRPGPPAVEPPDPPIDRSPERVRSLIARIDVDPYDAHFDYTPAVDDLIIIGEPALLPALEVVVNAPEGITRARAINVVNMVILSMHGFVRGQGWPGRAEEAAGQKALRELYGDIPNASRLEDASPEQRAAFAARVRAWLDR